MGSLADFSWYTGNLTWLPQRTIFLTKHGSHAYGTNLPDSDLDLKGIAIAPREYYLGFLKSFEQAECDAEPATGAPDVVIYDIRKFWKLAADCNPNIIEVLFTEQSDWIHPKGLWEGDSWWKVYKNRHLFLSQKARHTFSGYAISQLKRLQTHRGWLLNPPKKKPERSDFGLSNTEGTLGREQLGVINARIRKWEDAVAGSGVTKDVVQEQESAAVGSVVGELGLDRNLIPIILAERKFAAAARYFDSYQKWKAERNPRRAETEARFGYDTKHAMHLVRLLRMAAEILGFGRVTVKRPDAEELLEIRNGAWTYGALMEHAKTLEGLLPRLADTSPLPKEPDRAKLDQLLVEIVSAAL